MCIVVVLVPAYAHGTVQDGGQRVVTGQRGPTPLIEPLTHRRHAHVHTTTR